MLTRSPAEWYLTALAVDPRNSVDDVIALARRDQIFYVGRGYLADLKSNPPPPVRFNPRDGKHKPSMKFLLEKRVHDYYFQPWELREALDILRLPRVREIVETMLIAGVAHRFIAETAKAITRKKLKPGGIEFYRLGFWCMDLFPRRDIPALLDLTLDELKKSEDPALRAQYRYAKKYASKDPRRVAAQLPQNNLAAYAALSLFGARSQVDVGATVVQIRDTALVQAGVAAASGSVRDARRAEALMKVASLAQEMRTGVVNPHDEMAVELRRFTLRYDEERSKTFDEVCGGNYTTNVMPEERPEQAPS